MSMHLVLDMFIFTRALVADVVKGILEIFDSEFFFFFFGWCYSYGPQQGPDRQQKKRGERAQAEEKAKGSCSRRPRTKERKPGKRKKPK